jgi:Ca-activated chloride channel family protein
MTFIWPEMLWGAALLPLLVAAYRLLLRGKKQNLTLSNLGLVREALASATPWRRRVPPLLMLAAAALVVVAAARPAAVVPLPSDSRTIMLVMDVSGSMGAADVAPNRLTASQQAAKDFSRQLPDGVKVGVVAYGGTAHLVQAPTHDRDQVAGAIDRFQLQPGTAIGSGLVVALGTLFPEAGYDLGALMVRNRNPAYKTPQADEPPPREPGSHETAAIVMLTDGQNTTGVDPIEAAWLAARHGVKVFTVGFGSPTGAIVSFNGWSMKVWLDEETLKQIAKLTRGEYFAAPSGADLMEIYDRLKSRLVVKQQKTEITVFFTLAAALLALLGVALSVRWFGRVA